MKRWVCPAVAVGVCVAIGFMALTARGLGSPTWIVGGLGASSSSKSPSSTNQMASNSSPFDTQFTKKAVVPLNTYGTPQGQADEVFARLKARADQGEAMASFGIYQKLNECEQLLSQRVNDGLAISYSKATHGYDYLGIKRQAQNCHGAVEILKNERPELWLEHAADEGALIAQRVYATNQRTALGTPQGIVTPEQLIRYKKKAMGFLHSAASNGSSDAMFDLSNAYTQGFLVEKNPERAYAYAYAAAMQSGSSEAMELRNRYAVDLDSGQVRRGTIEGKKIFSQCCSAVRQTLIENKGNF